MPLLKQRIPIEKRAVYVFMRYLWNRNHRYKKNTAVAMTGDTGTSKTTSAVIFGYILNKKRFDESHYVNKASEFLEAVDDSRKGDSIVWDEAGVSLSARRWHTLSNILTAETLQTYRINYLTVFFVAPDLSFVDVQARKLMTIFNETKRYDTSKSFNWLYNLSVDRKKGDIYFPYYKIVVNDRLATLPKIIIPRSALSRVPDSIWKAIKKKEIEFKSSVRKKSLKTIRMMEKSERKSTDTIYDYINMVSKEKDKYMLQGKLDTSLIQTRLNISEGKALQIKKFIQKEMKE